MAAMEDTESAWITASGKSTSSEVPEEIQQEIGMTPGLVRFSVGLDHDIEDTYKSIEKSLKKYG